MKMLVNYIKWEFILWFKFIGWILPIIAVLVISVLLEPIISNPIYTSITNIVSGILNIASIALLVLPLIGTANDLGGKHNSMYRIINIPFFSMVASNFLVQIVFFALAFIIFFIAGGDIQNFNFLGIASFSGWRGLLFMLSLNSLLIWGTIEYTVIYTNKLGVYYRILNGITYVVFTLTIILRTISSMDLNTLWYRVYDFVTYDFLNGVVSILPILTVIYYIIAFGGLFIAKHLYETKYEAINVWE